MFRVFSDENNQEHRKKQVGSAESLQRSCESCEKVEIQVKYDDLMMTLIFPRLARVWTLLVETLSRDCSTFEPNLIEESLRSANFADIGL